MGFIFLIYFKLSVVVLFLRVEGREDRSIYGNRKIVVRTLLKVLSCFQIHAISSCTTNECLYSVIIARWSRLVDRVSRAATHKWLFFAPRFPPNTSQFSCGWDTCYGFLLFQIWGCEGGKKSRIPGSDLFHKGFHVFKYKSGQVQKQYKCGVLKVRWWRADVVACCNSQVVVLSLIFTKNVVFIGWVSMYVFSLFQLSDAKATRK